LSQVRIKHTGPLQGECTPPSDKSISHRSIILAALADGESTIKNFLRAEDPMRTLHAFQHMGIDIQESCENEIIVSGKGLKGLSAPGNVIDCGNSGTTMRLMSGVLAGQPFSSTLTGDQFLLKRPMERVIAPLTAMGANIVSEKGGYPPLHIQGGSLRPIQYTSPIASAQVKSAILLAGLYCDGETTVVEPGKSRDHTERMLRASGVDVRTDGKKVSVTGIAKLTPLDMTVPGDFSSAAFFIVAGLLVPGSEVLIKNVGINTTRTGLLDILQDMMEKEFEFLNIREVSGEPVADILVRHARLRAVRLGGDRVLRAIDEFPVLCVAAAKAEGTTKITGAGELRVKESDRIAAMASELKKMGVTIEELDDGIIIEGREDLHGAAVNSHGDHRIAMSMSVAGLTAEEETTVADTDCIDTSFPRFMEIVYNLGQKKHSA
jgi:3-phosphoshikimate 1-carboxyvinyltransferase